MGIPLPETTMALVKHFAGLAMLHQALDTATLELEQSKMSPVCLDNCGACCLRNTPFVWDIEGRNVLSCVLGNGGLTSLGDRVESWALDRVPGLTSYGLPSGQVNQQEWQASFREEVQRAMGLPCPLLDEDKRCVIYQSRPISCRAYGVTRVPGRECPRPLGMGETDNRRAIYSGPGGAEIEKGLNSFVSRLAPKYSVSWFLPMLLFHLIHPGKFKVYVEDNKIASAKLVVGKVSPNLIWQSQLTKVWSNN